MTMGPIKSLFRNFLVYHNQVQLWVNLNPQLQTPLPLHSSQSFLTWVCYGKKSSHFLEWEQEEVSHPNQERGSFSKFWRERSMAMQLGFNKIQFVHPEAVQDDNAGHQKHRMDFKISSSAS